MTNEQNEETPLNVIVTADAQSCSVSTLEFAVSMAAKFNCPLHALYIEDIDLLNSAGLSFSREITHITGEPRSLDPGSLQRSLNAISRQFKNELEKQAEKSAIQWHYSTVQGKKKELHQEGSISADYLIIDQKTATTNKKPGDYACLHILLIENKSPRLYQALRVMLAQSMEGRVELTLLTEGDIASPDTTKDLGDALSSHPNTHERQLSKGHLGLCMDTRLQQFDFVLVSRHQPDDLLQAILYKASCPVILVN